MKKLKGLDFKQVLIDHGEKFVFGLVALLGLAALGMSRWAPYDEKEPYDLLQQVDKAKQAHAVSEWPESEQQEYVATEDISEKARNLLASLDESKFAFGTTLPMYYWPVIPQQQPIDEPTWYPVDQLVADASVLLYAKAPEYDPTLVAEAEDAEGTAEEETNRGPRGRAASAFLPAQPRTGTGAESGYGYGYGAGAGYTPPGVAGPPGAARGGAATRAGTAARGGGAERGGATARGGTAARGTTGGRMASAMPGAPGEGGYGYSGGYGYGMAMTGGPVEAEAKRFVSIRGVFPIRQQERELARAWNAQSTAEVVDLLQFIDFRVERQTAVPGDDPWAGPWVPVDVQVANDVLSDAAYFDADVVDPTVTSAVFTSPLPGRVAGMWSEDDAGHEALSKFELSEEAKKQQEWLTARIAEYARQLEEQEKSIIRPRGFAQQQYDASRVSRMMLSDSTYMNEISGMPYPGAQQGANPTQLTKEQIKSLITASGTYLLFRYLDFEVEPGNAYRYRVQLELLNPAYGLEPGQVTRPDVAENQTRTTPWSEPSDPAIVPRDTRSFLAAIEPGTARRPDQARFDVYQWSEEYGTVVNSQLSVEPAQFIGGTTTAEVIDPAAKTFEAQDFTFTSDEMLVDIDMNATGLGRANPELNLSANLSIPSQVLVVNDWGGLEVRDPYSERETRGSYQSLVAQVAEAFSYLKQAAVAVGADGTPYGEYGSSYGGGYGGYGMGGMNPLRRGAARGPGGYSGGAQPRGRQP